MAIRLDLYARDVTLLPESRPAPAPDAAPERKFVISHGNAGYQLEFDGRRATVPDAAIRDLLRQVIETTSVDWRHSSDPSIQATFRPLQRIVQCINSTPSYHLFLAGFHVGDSIGMFDLAQLATPAIADSFRYLVGNLRWPRGKKGRLFCIPEGYVNSDAARMELMANGKLFAADLFIGDDEPTSHVANKLLVPYATPIGFNTRVATETEETWRRISDLMRRQGGGA